MKRILKKAIPLLLVVFVLTQILSVSVFAELEEMPNDLDLNSALDQARTSNDLDIFLLGNPDEKLPDVGIKMNNIQKLENIDSNKSNKSIWITADLQNSLLNDKSNIKKLDNYLDKGYTIYFLGLEDLNILSEKFTGNTSKDTLVEGDTQKAAFITKNKEGEYFFGHFISNESHYSKNMIEKIAASTWNRRNDHKYTRQKKNSKFSAMFTNKTFADSGNSFTIGTGWTCKYSWNQYNFDVIDSYNYKLGSYTEWKAGFYLSTPVDGKDYYALAIEGCMAPAVAGSFYSSDYLRYYGNQGPTQLLRQYAPTQSPATNTYTFSVGGSYNKTPTGTLGASWATSKSDIELLDSSQPSSQSMDIKFNYKWPLNTFTSYSTHTSWQDACIIIQGISGTTSGMINNSRVAQFARVRQSSTTVTASNSSSYSTYINK